MSNINNTTILIQTIINNKSYKIAIVWITKALGTKVVQKSYIQPKNVFM